MAQRNEGIGSIDKQEGSFLEKNQNLLVGIITAIVVLIGAYMAYSFLYQKPLEKEASASMFQAQVQFERDSFALALTNPGGGYMGFLDIADEYSSTDAGNLANYYAGISYLHLGEYDAAIEFLKDFSPVGDVTPIMKQGALGDAYSEKENYEKALSYYSEAVSYKNEYLTPYYLFKKGMLEMNLEKNEASYNTFTKLKEEYPNSEFASNVDKYIAMVEK